MSGGKMGKKNCWNPKGNTKYILTQEWSERTDSSFTNGIILKEIKYD
jgi:hypothetical protein